MQPIICNKKELGNKVEPAASIVVPVTEPGKLPPAEKFSARANQPGNKPVKAIPAAAKAMMPLTRKEQT